MSESGGLRTLLKSSFSTGDFYRAMNDSFKQMYGRYGMLHFSFYKNPEDDLFQGQINLTEHCISRLPEIKGKNILEIGCGNGFQSLYVLKNFQPATVTGIDINEYSINIAKAHVEEEKIENATFHVDNAQELSKIKSESMDMVINIESAFHYPNKDKFISEIYRVLKPGGHFLIADILNKKDNANLSPKKWRKGMSLFHWSENTYMEAFKRYGLEVQEREDITQPVIKGFKQYRNWFPRERPVGFFHYMALKLFTMINVYINIFLFSRRRDYIVFSGVKKN